MLNYMKQNLLLPLLLLFFLLFDGSLIVILAYLLNDVPYFISCATLVITLILFAIYLKDLKRLYLFAAIIGFIYDSYYSSILGVNLFAFPVIVWLVEYLKIKIPMNFYSTWFLVIFIYSLYTHFIYFLYELLNLHNDSFGTFLFQFYWPSLLFNGLVAFVLIWFIKKMTRIIQH